jgi:hypothetical protein
VSDRRDTAGIKFSVGKGGINLREDVVKVQEFLNNVMRAPKTGLK